MDPNYFHQWQNLQTMFCYPIALDRDTLVHLSHMPALIRLAFTLSDALPADPLFFLNLHNLVLYSEPLAHVSRFLSQTRLPVVTDLTAYIGSCPSRQDLFSFLAGIQTSSAALIIERLWLNQPWDLSVSRGLDILVLGLDHLRPCMAFSNLRCIRVNIKWDVDLTDSDLLMLASAWPHLEELSINPDWGWNTPSGITPDGLLQLLQSCQSLTQVTLVIDTRGYTQSSSSLESLGLTLPHTFSIDVLDSQIEAESVPAMAAYFAAIAPCPNFPFCSWESLGLEELWEICKERWDEVYRRANEALSHRS